MNQQPEVLNYHIIRPHIQRSLNPIDSDAITNSVHMIQLVGTLIKFNSMNSYVPYLAEKWTKKNHGKNWSFQLRPGLTCEDGTPIIAENYIKGIHLAFRNHAFKKDTPVFSLLKGWKDFYDGNSPNIAGISSPSELEVKFDFDQVPDGVELYLSMPYYGFYCQADFDEKGKWKYENQITSSGPYRLKMFDRDKDIISLELREDWPALANKYAPKTIRIFGEKDASIISNFQKNTIVNTDLDESTYFDPRWTVFKGAKIISGNLVLNTKSEAFKNEKFRKFFAKKIREKIDNYEKNFKWILVSSRFYPFVDNEKVERPPVAESVDGSKIPKSLRFMDFLLSNGREVTTLDILKRAFDESGIELKFAPRIPSNMSSFEAMNYLKNTHDIYLVNVDKGGAATTSVVGMMFCSDLGANFPDPSGRVCELVKKYGSRELTAAEAEEFGEEFERIVEEDAAVIPIIHRGQNWLYSDDLDLSAMTPNMTFPDLQLVKLK